MINLKNYSWLLNYTNNHFTIVRPRSVTDSLLIKPRNALNSNFIGITTLHVSGSLSAHHQEFGFGTFYAVVMSHMLQQE
jgi:hypothetical protein